jgi:hypothetical protein
MVISVGLRDDHNTKDEQVTICRLLSPADQGLKRWDVNHFASPSPDRAPMRCCAASAMHARISMHRSCGEKAVTSSIAHRSQKRVMSPIA